MVHQLTFEGDSTVTARPDGAPEPSGLGCLVIVARHHGLHLTVSQLVHDNVLGSQEVTARQLVQCAENSGLKAKLVTLGWSDLGQLKKALPVIVRLKNGGSMVLLRLEGDEDALRVILQDPNADEDSLLALDQVRFNEAWGGEVVLIKRDYDISDENQPFSLGLVAGLIMRERSLVRDVATCAFVLGMFGLTPIIFMRLVSSQVINYKSFNTLYVLCIGLVVAIGFETIFGYLRRLLVLHLTTRLDVKLSTYIFEKLLNLPMDFFERKHVGEITHDVAELWKIRRFLMGQLFGTVLDTTTLLFFLPAMFLLNATITLVVLGLCGLIVLWLIIMLPHYRKISSVAEIAESQRGAFLVQTVHGMRTVKSLALDARQRHQWDVHVAKVAKLRLSEGLMGNVIHSATVPLERLAVNGTMGLGVYLALISPDPLALGAIFAFWMLSSRVVSPLVQMAQLVNQFDEARLAVQVVKNLVNQPAEEGRSGHGVRVPLKGHLEFSKVTFKYKGASSPALQDVSFEVPEGTTLGVMGKSGSGKTTITRLIQRLHSNYEGLIKVDGVDVREYDVDHLRRSIGVVLQENFLFSGTIRENIAAAKTDATFDEVVNAARLAGAEEFIDKLPRGYETHIYEGSPNLSGGQRQRLAIARALIVNPRILILDEATSALDADSEAIVTANIGRIAHGRTLVIVSHRLSSLVTADAILVMDNGRVEDVGRHAELLERNDIYSDLWHTQNRHIVDSAAPAKTPIRKPTLVS